MRGEMNFPILCRNWVQKKQVAITENQVRFKNGSLIMLSHLRTDEDFEKAQGIGKHVMAIDEATQCKQQHIAGLRGWVRMSEEMKDKLPAQLRPLYPHLSDEQLRDFFPRIIYTANPMGASVGYFRRNFVLCQPEGKIWRAPDDEGGFMRQYIPSKIIDNLSSIGS